MRPRTTGSSPAAPGLVASSPPDSWDRIGPHAKGDGGHAGEPDSAVSCAEERFRQAKTVPEKIEALGAMLAVIPRPKKGTEHLRGDLKGAIPPSEFIRPLIRSDCFG